MSRRRPSIAFLSLFALAASSSCSRKRSDDPPAIRAVVAEQETGPFDFHDEAPDVSLALGGAHSCAIVDGLVKCWGANDQGQLGNGTTQDALRPAVVPNLATATTICLGGQHTCARLADGTLKCWGYNGSGQLGDGTHLARPIPTVVPGIRDAVDVVCGGTFTCARIKDGTVKCWGQNTYGQLGDGTTKERTRPVQVFALRDAVEITAGSFATCARLGTGEVRCWGGNATGEIGDGTHADRARPTPIPALAGAARIANGSSHACALMGDRSLRCWGGNMLGELGDGTTTERTTPITPLPIDGRIDEVRLGSHNTCVRTIEGDVKCWGWRAFGQLADGALRTLPYYVTTPTKIGALPPVMRIALGDEHVCARLYEGTIVCWGRNDRGQIGDGSRDDRAAPTPIAW